MIDLSEKLESLGLLQSSAVTSAVSDVLATLSMHNLTENQEREVLDLISSKGLSEIIETPLFSDDAWVDFDYGNVKIGDYVRVKPNVYDSDTGSKHNSRVGVLVTIRARRCTVRYLGINHVYPMQHPIRNLQSLKHGVQ